MTFNMNIFENNTMFTEDEAVIYADRRDFVENVGILASQTREGVERIEYIKEDDLELAKIVYKRDSKEKYVNINHDSFSAIVRDIFKHI